MKSHLYKWEKEVGLKSNPVRHQTVILRIQNNICQALSAVPYQWNNFSAMPTKYCQSHNEITYSVEDPDRHNRRLS